MPDIKQSIAVLSATPYPPRFSKIHQANVRVAQLEAELAAVKGQTATATPLPTVQGQPAPSTPKPTGFISTERLHTAMLRMHYVDNSLREKPDHERRITMATIAWQNRLTYAGCENDFRSIDTAKVKRNVADTRYFGLDRAATAIRQASFEGAMK